MKNINKKEILNHIKTLQEFQNHLFEQGHTFWACDAEDETRKKPFYFYQINRSKHMVTCSTCYQLMENRKKIRKLQKKVGLKPISLITNYTETNHIKRISVNNSSCFNVNYSYI